MVFLLCVTHCGNDARIAIVEDRTPSPERPFPVTVPRAEDPTMIAPPLPRPIVEAPLPPIPAVLAFPPAPVIAPAEPVRAVITVNRSGARAQYALDLDSVQVTAREFGEPEMRRCARSGNRVIIHFETPRTGGNSLFFEFDPTREESRRINHFTLSLLSWDVPNDGPLSYQTTTCNLTFSIVNERISGRFSCSNLANRDGHVPTARGRFDCPLEIATSLPSLR